MGQRPVGLLWDGVGFYGMLVGVKIIVWGHYGIKIIAGLWGCDGAGLDKNHCVGLLWDCVGLFGIEIIVWGYYGIKSIVWGYYEIVWGYGIVMELVGTEITVWGYYGVVWGYLR